MNLTNRMKFALIQKSIITVILLILLSVFWFFYIYQEIKWVEEIKNELSTNFDYYQHLKKEGMSFWTAFNILRRLEEFSDNHTQSIFSEITPDFYTRNFTNSSHELFYDFLNHKRDEIWMIRESNEFQEQNEMLNTFLPVYSPIIQISGDDMSIAEFINDVENIFRKFNLDNYSGEIGIRNIYVLDDDTEGQTSNNQRQDINSSKEDIFVIPLNFRIEGMKWNIVNFIHYMSHVWSAFVDTDNNVLRPYNDTFFWLSNNQEQRSISYYNQIATIERISFSEYIDSSFLQSNTDFISRIREIDQFRERYSIDISINFYVTWYPQAIINDTIAEMIESIEDNFLEMNKNIQISPEEIDNNSFQQTQNYRDFVRNLNRLQQRLDQVKARNVIWLWQTELINLLNELQNITLINDRLKKQYNNFIK